MCFMFNKYQVFFIAVLTATYDVGRCDAISNTNFNSHIRDYTTEDANNITHAKTLQKEDIARYATFSPTGNPITFKEIPDSTLSSTSHSRGLYHDQPGYSLHDYEEGPHYTYEHDYHLQDAHPDVHGAHGYDHDHNEHHGHHDLHDHHDHHDHYDHHDHHNPHDHHGYDHHHHSGYHHLHHGHYNKHYKHALAAKTVLWPIAGIALLGAAAALVSNPVLLQLGVVSGKRRRRDTEEITGPDLPSDMFMKYAEKIKSQKNHGKIILVNENLKKYTRKVNSEKVNSPNENLNRRILRTDNFKDVKLNAGLRKMRSSVKRVDQDNQVTNSPGYYNNNDDDDRFIPIPIQLRTPNIDI